MSIITKVNLHRAGVRRRTRRTGGCLNTPSLKLTFLVKPRPHMIFPHPRTHIGGGVATPHAISSLIEIELWNKDQTNPWDVLSPMVPELTTLGHVLTDQRKKIAILRFTVFRK